MDQKYGEFIGVDSLYYSLITQDDDNAYVAGAPVYLAPVAEIAGEPKINKVTTYYDNKAANNYVTEGETALKITIPNVPASLMAILLGKLYAEASGRVYDSGEPDPPDVALGFRYNMGRDEYRYYWYLKGSFSAGPEEAASKKDNVEIKTYQLTFTAVSTTFLFTIGAETKSLKRVFADTADDAFDPDGWFDQVQTPDAVGAPDALVLSSIVPIDGASGIARNTTVVLTFNNKIESESITLLNTTTGDAVEVSKAWNVAGKVLTITPSSQLGATTKYLVAVAGVVDVYGQELAAAGKDFTTTS